MLGFHAEGYDEYVTALRRQLEKTLCELYKRLKEASSNQEADEIKRQIVEQRKTYESNVATAQRLLF